jgi:hypothetical protein
MLGEPPFERRDVERLAGPHRAAAAILRASVHFSSVPQLGRLLKAIKYH